MSLDREIWDAKSENFIITSSLQVQHILNIACHLNVPELRPIFEGEGP
jgi:hypothetical protein